MTQLDRTILTTKDGFTRARKKQTTNQTNKTKQQQQKHDDITKKRMDRATVLVKPERSIKNVPRFYVKAENLGVQTYIILYGKIRKKLRSSHSY